ncbi:paraneoplastic antigen Ma1 homolog [Rana temporaria]|uniref:paraneoplastic antigen Ma1 homolog n=1 Tax=Rana temporaria TaxID=8407 RepID=UPI001AAC9732|nr:paraneoplastic antigen Ma1 homolog [Rana temporaria]
MSPLVDSLIQKHNTSANQGYRKLQIFLGRVPRPDGEEEFESWMDQAMQAIEEWDVSEAVRRQRISESLRSPAADVSRSQKRGRPDCEAMDYIEALYTGYGRVEKLPGPMYKFEHTHQWRGEKLSDYVVRVDRILHQIILKKGIHPREVDRVRLDQTLQGARPNHLIVLRLLLKGTRKAPSYPELMGLTPQKSEKVVAQSVQVDANVVESDEKSEWGECTKTPVEQSTPKVTLVKSPEEGGQVHEQVQQALLQVMEAQAERTGIRKCYKCDDPRHFRAQCQQKEGSTELLAELVKMLQKLLKEQPVGNFGGS